MYPQFSLKPVCPAVFCSSFFQKLEGLISKSLNALVALFKLLCAGAFLLKLFLKA
jgi:hypothetical protein